MQKKCRHCERVVERKIDTQIVACYNCQRLRNNENSRNQSKRRRAILNKIRNGEIESKKKYFHTMKYIEKKQSQIKDLSLNILTGIEKDDLETLSKLNKLMFNKMLKERNFNYLI